MKNLIKLLPIILLLGSCIQNNSETQKYDLDKNIELIQRFIVATDAQEFNSYDEFLSDDVVAHFPGVDLGRAEVEQNEKSFAIAFPDAKREIHDLIAQGDKVVLRETFNGTHQAEFNGIQATGRKVRVGAIVIYRISEGTIVESWVEADFAGLMNQLTAAESSQAN
jgi:predicted ester cyclase